MTQSLVVRRCRSESVIVPSLLRNPAHRRRSAQLRRGILLPKVVTRGGCGMVRSPSQALPDDVVLCRKVR